MFAFSTSNQKALHSDCPRTTSSSPVSHRPSLKVNSDIQQGSKRLRQIVKATFRLYTAFCSAIHLKLRFINKRTVFQSSTVLVFLSPPRAFGLVSPPEKWFRNCSSSSETSTNAAPVVIWLIGVLRSLVCKFCICDEVCCSISQGSKLDLLIF